MSVAVSDTERRRGAFVEVGDESLDRRRDEKEEWPERCSHDGEGEVRAGEGRG